MDRYTQQLVQLQPPGNALPTHPESKWVKLLAGIAAEFERVHQRIDALVMEMLLQGGEELLDDWEASLDLPDVCMRANPPTDPDLRRLRIRAKIAETGGQNEDYFIGIANALGLAASIDVFKPFEMGISGMGDPIGGADQRYIWVMNFAEDADPVRLALAKCIVREAAPKHTQVLFGIGSELEHLPVYMNGQGDYDGTLDYGAGYIPFYFNGQSAYNESLNYGG